MIPEKTTFIFPNRACGTGGKRTVWQNKEAIERGEKVSDKIQGVLSKIEFPLGQDEYAVSQAIHQLLSEGWEFIGITKTHLSLMRTWEVDLSGNGMVAKDEAVREKIGKVPKFHLEHTTQE